MTRRRSAKIIEAVIPDAVRHEVLHRKSGTPSRSWPEAAASPDPRRGSILVTTLFLAALVAALAGTAAVVVRAAHLSSRSFAEEIRAEVAARGAIEWIVTASAAAPLDRRRSGIVRLEGVEVAVDAVPESGRIDLNAAPMELIASLFRVVGVEEATAAGYAARIADWRDGDDNPEDVGAERETYRGVGRTDGPRNGPFPAVAELAQVLDLPAAAVAAVTPFLTVASGLAGVDPRFASPTVLAAILGDRGSPGAVAAAPTSPGALRARLASTPKHVTRDRSPGSRITGTVRVGRWSERRFEAIVAILAGDPEPFRLVSLTWIPTPASLPPPAPAS